MMLQQPARWKQTNRKLAPSSLSPLLMRSQMKGTLLWCIWPMTVSRQSIGMPTRNRAIKQGMRKAPPPFLQTRYGNLQKDPNPTANPIKDITYSQQLSQWCSPGIVDALGGYYYYGSSILKGQIRLLFTLYYLSMGLFCQFNEMQEEKYEKNNIIKKQQQLCELILHSQAYTFVRITNKLIPQILQALDNWVSIGEQQKKIFTQIMNTLYTKLQQFTLKNSFYRIQYLINEFDKITGIRLHIVDIKNSSIQQPIKNEVRSKFFNLLYQPQIKKSTIFTNKIIELMNNEFITSNPQCLGCSQNFYEERKIPDYNEHLTNLLCLSFKECKDQVILSQNICSLANSKRGGFLLIGVEKQKIQGKKLNSDRKKQYSELIAKALLLLGPSAKINKLIRFDFLPVLENPEQNGKIRMKTKKEIIRINIKSSHRQVFYKIQKKNTTNPSYFLFQYKNNKVEEVLGKDIYKFILKTFHNKETKGQHKCNFPQKLNLESPENSIKEDSNSDIEDELTVFKKFKSHLLIRLTTPKNNFLITKISDILKQNKEIFEFTEPFKGQWKKYDLKNLAVWLLSFDGKTDGMIKAIKQINISNLINYYNIERNFWVQFKEQRKGKVQQLEKQIFKMWKEKPEKIDHQPGGEKKVYLSFSNYTISTFAYIFFQLRDIRPTFINYIHFQHLKNK